MKLNKAARIPTSVTHEGAIVPSINVEYELRRTVMACMLWEDSFYESGQSVADRIAKLVPQCRPEWVAACAAHARSNMKLRHVPLLLVAHMAKYPEHKKLVGKLLADVIMRPDEITEFLAIYWHLNRDKARGVKQAPLANQIKKGLAGAFKKFNEYQFAKYDRDTEVKLRDALFLCHGKPADVYDYAGYTKAHRRAKLKRALTEGEKLYGKIVSRTLDTPDTWEVALSGGADKKETFERLMDEKKLGALAFLRNLRNMHQAGIDKAKIAAYAEKVNIERILPFRFIAAANAVPAWEDVIEQMMFRCLEGQEKLEGTTVLLVDISSSMGQLVSSKSDISRRDAAAAIAILLRELCEDVRIYGFAGNCELLPPRRGFAIRESLLHMTVPQWTALGEAVRKAEADGPYDRIIAITDEQTMDRPPRPKGKGYVINVGTYENGVSYSDWMHIDGWSEAVIDYIREYERFTAESHKKTA